MPEPSVGIDSEAEIPKPPSPWWRQRGLFIAEAVGAAALLAGVLVVLAPWSDFMRGLVGGALLGLGAAMIVGTPFSARDRWEQQLRDYQVWRATKEGTAPLIALIRAQAGNAFYLGSDVRMLSADQEDIQVRLAIAIQRCAASGIAFSEKESKLIARSNPTPKAAARISDLIAEKAQLLGAREWTYFQLGQLVCSIVKHLEGSRPLQPITRRLDQVRQNQFIQLDACFNSVVTDLLTALSGFDETVTGEPRRMMLERVFGILDGLPSPKIDTYGQEPRNGLVDADEWYWTQDPGGKGIPVCFSAGYMLVAQDAWDYTISRDDPEYEASVKRSQTAWGCSVHPESSEDSPCFDMQLVFDHTNGGMPVTRARTVLVTSAPATSPELAG